LAFKAARRWSRSRRDEMDARGPAYGQMPSNEAELMMPVAE